MKSHGVVQLYALISAYIYRVHSVYMSKRVYILLKYAAYEKAKHKENMMDKSEII